MRIRTVEPTGRLYELNEIHHCGRVNDRSAGRAASTWPVSGIVLWRLQNGGIASGNIIRKNVLYVLWGEGIGVIRQRNALVEDNRFRESCSVGLLLECQDSTIQRDFTWKTGVLGG